jgi:hypothetical protein
MIGSIKWLMLEKCSIAASASASRHPHATRRTQYSDRDESVDGDLADVAGDYLRQAVRELQEYAASVDEAYSSHRTGES